MSNLVKYTKMSPWLDSDSVFSQMDNFFKDVFNPYLLDTPNTSLSLFEKSAYPRLDIRDEPDRIVVEVETPGLNKEDIKVEVDNDVLIVRGEKRKDVEEKKGNYIRRELKHSSFSRQVCTLNENCETDKIDASFKNGILEIVIPKKKVEEKKIQPKQIAVK